MKIIKSGPETKELYHNGQLISTEPVVEVIVENIKNLRMAKRMQGGLVNTEDNENCQYLLQYENETEIIAQYVTEVIAAGGRQENLIPILTNMKNDLLDMFNQQHNHATTT